MQLILAQSVAHVEAARGHPGAAPQAAALLGLAPLLSLGLAAEAAGFRFYPYTDYVTAAEFAGLALEAERLSHTWFAEVAGAPEAAEAVDSLRLEVLGWFTELLLARHVIGRVLAGIRPASVHLPSGLDGKLAAIAHFEADRLGIPVVHAPGPAAPGGRRRRLAGALRQFGRAEIGLAAHRLRQAREARPVVLAYGAGVDSVNQQRLLPALAAAQRVRLLLVRSGEVDSSSFNRPAQPSSAPVPFVPLRAMFRSGRYLARCRRWLAAFRASQAAYQGPHACLFANRWLDPTFERIFLYLLPRILATQRDAGALLRRVRPRLLLTGNEVSFPVRLMVAEARRRGIATLGLVHSGLNNMLYRDFQAERMAVWGEVHVRDFVRALGKDNARLVALGNPHYDTLACPPSPEPGGRAGCPRVLVITAVSQWHTFCFDLRRHEQTWRQIARLPEAGVQVLIKPHPRFDDDAFYQGLPGALPDWRAPRPGVALVRDAFLEQVLPACDLVLVPSFPTTGAVEAMLCRKPVVYLRPAPGPSADIPFCTAIDAGCLVIDAEDQIVPGVLEILRSSERQAEAVLRGQAFLDRLLGPRDGQATARLADYIASLAEGRP